MYNLIFKDRNGNTIDVNDEILLTTFGRTYYIKVEKIIQDQLSSNFVTITYHSGILIKYVTSKRCEKIPSENRNGFLMLKKLEGVKIFNSDKIADKISQIKSGIGKI